jgi:hypothetical protein
MSDAHVKRAIVYLERKAQERWPDFVRECNAAIGCWDEQMGGTTGVEDALEDANGWTVCLHPMHEHLVAEAERRGLEVER